MKRTQLGALIFSSLLAHAASAACGANEVALDGTIERGAEGVRFEVGRAEGQPVRIPIMGWARISQRLQGLCLRAGEADQVLRFPRAYVVAIAQDGTYAVWTRAAATTYRPASAPMGVPR